MVNLQAGVVDGHFRGGRSGEVQYQVDGVSVNNAYDNTSSLRLDRSLLQEVQVISGTFDAEYGQAMSGVVNAVLKDGGAKLRVERRGLPGRIHWFPGRERARLTDEQPRSAPASRASRRRSADRWRCRRPCSWPTRATPRSTTTCRRSGCSSSPRSATTPCRRLHPLPGDGSQSRWATREEWSGLLKLTNRSLPNVKLSYQAIVNDSQGRRTNYSYRYNPDGQSQQHTFPSPTASTGPTRSASPRSTT